MFDLLNSIINAINNLTNSVSSVPNAVLFNLSEKIDDLRNTVSGISDSVRNNVSNIVAGLSNDIFNIKNVILGNLGGMLSGLANNVGTLVSSVQTGIGNAVASITTTIGDISGKIQSAVNGGIDNLRNVINDTTQAVKQNLFDNIVNIGKTISDVKDSLTNAIQTKVSDVEKQVSDTIDTVKKALESDVSDVGTTVKTLATNIQTLASQFDITKLTDSLDKLLKPETWLDAVKSPLNTTLANITKNLDERRTNKSNVLERLARGEYRDVNEFIRDALDPPPALDPISSFADLLYQFFALVTSFSTLAPIYSRAMMHFANEIHETEIFTPETLANMVAQNIATYEQAVMEGAWSGLDRAHMDQLILLAGEPPGMGELFDLLNRGIITEDDVRQGLKESRVKNKYIDNLMKLRFIIPPLSDIVRMAVRDAWRDDVAGKYGYDQDYPQEFAANAQKLGLDPDWAKRYWRAHWELPSVNEVFEMLHRSSETGVTSADVEEYLRINDYPSYWRDKLLKISYEVFTRVDVRRMYKLGVLDRDGVKRAYLDLGYDETRAEKLTDFTVKYEDETGQINPDTLSRRLFDAVLRLYVAGKRTDADVRAAGQSVGYSTEVIESELKIAQLQREIKNKVDDAESVGLTSSALKREIINTLETLYSRGQRDINQVEQQLRDLGLDGQPLALEMQVMTLKRELYYKPPAYEKARELSTNSILDAYSAHLISEQDAIARLKALGLSDNSASLQLSTRQFDDALSIRKQIVKAIEDAFKQGDITEDTASQTMVQYGYSLNEVNQYLTLWTLQKSLQHKRFTESQLAGFLKRGIISIDEYAAQLAAMGYNQTQIEWLVKSRGG